MKALLSLLVATFLLLHGGNRAQANNKRILSYEFDRAWPAAVRFVRIDEGLKITEKDKETGYVVFERKNPKDAFTGTLELVRTTDRQGRDAVKVRIRLPKRPSYIADGMFDRLSKKMRDDLGDPRPPPEPEPKETEEPPKKAEEPSGIQLREKP